MSSTRERRPRHAADAGATAGWTRRVAAARRGGRGAGRRAPRHSATVAPLRARKLLVVTAVLALLVLAILAGTGSTSALWTGSRTVTGPAVRSGSTGLTIDGQTDRALPNLRVAALAPGESATAPLTVRNTGTTPVSIRVSGTEMTAEANGLADSLTASVTPSVTCSAGLPGGQTGALRDFATASPLGMLAPGGELAICLEVRLDGAAPGSVQGGSADFVMTFEATQERPA